MGKLIDKIQEKHLVLILIFTFMLLMSAFVWYVIYQLQAIRDEWKHNIETALIEFYDKYELSVDCNK